MVIWLKFLFMMLISSLFIVQINLGNSICGTSIREGLVLDEDLLCGNLEGPAIELDADGISIDCQGHKIIANSNFGVVYALGKNNLSIKNCVIEGDSYAGLRFDSVSFLTIENNIASGLTKGIIIEGGSINSALDNNNLMIKNNILTYSKEFGIDFESGGGLAHNEVVIIGNDVSNSDTGMSIHQVRGLVLENNAFSNNRIGLYMSRGIYNLKNVVIENPKQVGLSLANIMNSVFNNIEITGNSEIGVFVDTEVVGDTNTNNIFDGIIANGKGIGMFIKGQFSNNIIRNNDFSNSYDSGIKTKLSGNTKQERNSYYNNNLSNSGTAIHIDGNNFLSLDASNKFLNSKVGLIIERSRYVDVRDLDLSSIKNTPIEINGCVDCMFKKIKAGGIGGIGLQILYSGYVNNGINVEDVDFSGREKGILIEGGKNILVKNSLFHDNFDCIEIKGSWNKRSENVLIESNQLYKCGRDGIRANYLYNSIIAKNKIVESKNIGIFLGDDDTGGNRIFENVLYRNGVGVLILSGSLNKLYKNIFLDSNILHAFSVPENYFNEELNGVIEGNCWGGSEVLEILDSNLDGYGDSGNNYPYSKANGGFVGSNVVDYGPMMECVNLDSDHDGVFDKSDVCPDTRDNKLVQKNGCNCEQMKSLFFESHNQKGDGEIPGNGICQALGINPQNPQGSGHEANGLLKKFKIKE